mgnify:CR=1 FL=1
MSDSFEMRPIARIRSDFGSKFGVPRQSGLVDALEAAGLARMAEWRRVRVLCSYAQYERVRRLLGDFGAEDQEASFGADVEIGALLPAGSGGSFSARLADLTAGGAMFEEEGSVFRPQKI